MITSARERILVLGAENFIGHRLLRQLHAAEWASPVAAVRSAAPEPKSAVEYRIVNPSRKGSVAQALAGIDTVVDCIEAGAKEVCQDARILFEAAAQMTPTPRIIYLSSMSVYGDALGLVDETAPLKGDLGPYSVARIEAEHLAAAHPRAVVLRAGCIYGPHSTRWSIWFARWLMSRRLGDLGNQGDGYCNLVHVDDVVQAIVRCLQQPPQLSVFNLSSPDPPTWNDYLIHYGRALRAIPIRRVSRQRLLIETMLFGPPLKLTELALRASKLPVTRLPPAMPPSLLRLMRQEIRLDVRRAEQQLGLRWKPLEEGIEETARWYLATQHSP